MTTPAEALEEVLAKDGSDFEIAAVRFITTHADTLRAALATPQVGEVEHEHVYCPHCRPCKHSERINAYDGVLRGLASYLSAGGFNAPGLIEPDEADAKIRWGIDNFVKTEVARLLRATQSTNMTPAVAGSPSALSERPASSELLEATATPVQSAPWQRADGNYTWQGAAPAPCVSCSDEQQCAAYQRGVIAGKRSAAPAQEPVAWQIKVAGVWAAVPHEPEWEPGIEARPLYAAPQPAPAQEPRAWEHWSLTEPCYLQGIYPKKRLSFHHVPLYAAPQPDEAREILRELVTLKALKDQDWMSYDEKIDYAKRKPLAWDAARTYLARHK